MKIDRAALEKARDDARAEQHRLHDALTNASPEEAPAAQRAYDRATGYYAALEALFDETCRFPVAPGTVVHGIDVSKLGWQTRAMVLSRNLATIYALGGRPDPE